eukprot:4380336-Amphidinium_carterae.1
MGNWPQNSFSHVFHVFLITILGGFPRTELSQVYISLHVLAASSYSSLSILSICSFASRIIFVTVTLLRLTSQVQSSPQCVLPLPSSAKSPCSESGWDD